MKPVIQLSPLMQQAVRSWHQNGHHLDVTLLNECAYYPRQGCDQCTFNNPNPHCKRAHILVDTRIGFNWVPPQKQVQKDTLSTPKQPKTREEKLSAMEKFCQSLPSHVREEVMRVLEKEVR
jgi:hypothetical protein